MPQIGSLTVAELKAKLDAGETPRIIDVREPSEYHIARIPNAELKPLGQIMQWMQELGDHDQELIMQCHHGMRSQRAGEFLAANGFTNVHNLTGGIDAWSAYVDPSVPRY
jgi:rhodanese-related sulfurtransferase